MEIASGPDLISAKAKEPLSTAFQVTGGTPPFRWTASGDLPQGLSMDPATGVLAGTPDELKTGTILIRVMDATGFPATRSVPFSITTDPLEIIPEQTPEARRGRDFKWAFQTKGGLSPRPIKLAPESTLPPGLYLSFNGSTARIQGKPRSEGTFSFTLVAEDAGSAPVRKDLVLTILSSAPEIAESPLPVQINTTSLPPASLDTAYNQNIESSGGVPPLKLALKAGSHLPPGLLLVKDRLSGTPTVVSNHTFTLTATDVQGSSAEAALSLVVGEKPMQIAGTRSAKGEEFKPFNRRNPERQRRGIQALQSRSPRQGRQVSPHLGAPRATADRFESGCLHGDYLGRTRQGYGRQPLGIRAGDRRGSPDGFGDFQLHHRGGESTGYF
jgi:hypothetical protein